jgi:hypothetical protein
MDHCPPPTLTMELLPPGSDSMRRLVHGRLATPKNNRRIREIVLALFAESANLFSSAGNEAPAQPNEKMKKTINPTIAEKLCQEIESAGFAEYAEFMGLESHLSEDIAEMTAEEIAAAAEISVEEAETLLIAISIADEPSLFSAWQILFNSF